MWSDNLDFHLSHPGSDLQLELSPSMYGESGNVFMATRSLSSANNSYHLLTKSYEYHITYFSFDYMNSFSPIVGCN